MPRIDELPLPAQNELKAQRGELGEGHPEKQRRSLMSRLASVGLGRKGEEPVQAPRTAQPMQMPQMERPPVPMAQMERAPMPHMERPPRPSPRHPEGRQAPVSDYARRSGPQGLDPHGRPAPVHNPAEDDQLDIPAFLRRQAN
jgi:cell division protein FtsZ